MKEKEIYQKVHQFIKEHRMVEKGDRIIIGLSGGADSMALTDLLYRMQAEWELKLLAVHVNHGIRGAEAERDEATARNFCGARNIPFRSFCYRVPQLAKEKQVGVEEMGRSCRKQAFLECLQEVPGERGYIALAHNENDLAETMLHHLSRGTGLRGLTGILPVSGEIIRPLLCLNRTEIENYCKDRELPYVTDSTNLEDHYTRNRIRHHILPALQNEVNGEVLAHMSELAEQVRDAENYLQSQAEALLERQEKQEQGFILNNSFFEEPEILKSYAVLLAMEKLCGKRKDLTSVHVKNILNLKKRETSKMVMLPYGIQAKRVYEGVLLEKKKGQEQENTLSERELSLEGGNWSFGEKTFVTKVFPYSGQEISEKKYTKWFDYDKIKSKPVIRTRRTGDFLILNADGQKKKLQRYLIDEKIPSEIREKILLLAVESEILWVVGGRISEKYKVDQNTKKIFQVEYKGGE